jgi:hypothetical protein
MASLTSVKASVPVIDVSSLIQWNNHNIDRNIPNQLIQLAQQIYSAATQW